MRAILFLISIIGLCACQRQAHKPIHAETATVSFSVDCPNMETLTRALTAQGESAVKDLNVYMFHKSVDVVKHFYITSQTNLFSVNLVKGEYDLFVVANHGSDTGAKTIDAVRGFESTISTAAEIESRGSLLMAAHQSVSISGNTTIPVTLTRKIAKVEFNLSITPAFDFVLSSVQVRNAPSRVAMFHTSAASAVFDYAASTAAGQFYLFENAQGINGAITDQQQKNRVNAPKNATYIHIQGYSDGKKVEYYIYLGENNTFDFNVYGNKHYIINAVISGINEIDSRVSTSELTAVNFAPEYKPGETAQGSLLLTSKNNTDNSFTLSYRILDGSGSVLINGVNYPQNSPIPFLNIGELSKSAAVSYTQSGSSAARIAFTATDRYGFTLNRELSTSYAQIQEITLSQAWENLPNKTVKIWATATSPVFSDITLDCGVNAAILRENNTTSRGYWFEWSCVIKAGTTASEPKILSIVPYQGPQNIWVVGIWIPYVGQVGDRPYIDKISKDSDNNGAIIYKIYKFPRWTED